jgi:hypothetical protein
MKIKEIIEVPDQKYPPDIVQEIWDKSTFTGEVIDGLDVYFYATASNAFITLAKDKEIAAIARFLVKAEERIWQAKRVQTRPNFKGRNLAAKMYIFVRDMLEQQVQSDDQQTASGATLWTRTLPSLGEHPEIYDTTAKAPISRGSAAWKDAIKQMYSTDPIAGAKYTWILN